MNIDKEKEQQLIDEIYDRFEILVTSYSRSIDSYVRTIKERLSTISEEKRAVFYCSAHGEHATSDYYKKKIDGNSDIGLEGMTALKSALIRDYGKSFWTLVMSVLWHEELRNIDSLSDSELEFTKFIPIVSMLYVTRYKFKKPHQTIASYSRCLDIKSISNAFKYADTEPWKSRIDEISQTSNTEIDEAILSICMAVSSVRDCIWDVKWIPFYAQEEILDFDGLEMVSYPDQSK